MTVTNDRSMTTAYKQLFSSVVLAAIDDAIKDEQLFGNGVQSIGDWARSRDGTFVLRCAGVEPSNRTVKGLQNFVRKGVKTSCALVRESTIQPSARSFAFF